MAFCLRNSWRAGTNGREVLSEHLFFVTTRPRMNTSRRVGRREGCFWLFEDVVLVPLKWFGDGLYFPLGNFRSRRVGSRGSPFYNFFLNENRKGRYSFMKTYYSDMLSTQESGRRCFIAYVYPVREYFEFLY